MIRKKIEIKNLSHDRTKPEFLFLLVAIENKNYEEQKKAKKMVVQKTRNVCADCAGKDTQYGCIENLA